MEAKSEILNFIFDGKDLDDLDDSAEDYIDKLCSIGILNLEREPFRLADEKTRLDEAIKEEALKNYDCFLQAHKFTKEFKQEFKEVHGKLDQFIEKIPIFKDKLFEFSDEAKDLTKRWKQASLMLSKQNQLLGFLEIPLLMDSCVRKGYYDEALQLYSYVQRLDRRHGKDAPIIQIIFNELFQFKELMISQLVKELYGNIQLPSALKIIGYLRRIDVYNETELRIKFLNARDAWLKSLVKDIPTTNPLIFMGKIIEIYRINLFDTVTQYRALFADEEITSSSNKLLVNAYNSNYRDFGDETILTSWISNKIDQFLVQLENTLDKCLEAEYSSVYPIENLFDPCFYFGLSMSRIGADFRPILSTIFQKVILSKFSQSIEKAIAKFEINMENYSLSSLPSSVNSSSQSESSSPSESTNFDPPIAILSFSPLAFLCNDILETLNQVRKLVPLTLVIKFRDILNVNLTKASEILLNYHKTESNSIGLQESDLLRQMLVTYVDHLLPHIQKCFSAIAPIQQLSKNLGLTALEYNRLKKSNKHISFSDLDMESIKSSIDGLLNR